MVAGGPATAGPRAERDPCGALTLPAPGLVPGSDDALAVLVRALSLVWLLSATAIASACGPARENPTANAAAVV